MMQLCAFLRLSFWSMMLWDAPVLVQQKQAASSQLCGCTGDQQRCLALSSADQHSLGDCMLLVSQSRSRIRMSRHTRGERAWH